MGHLLNASSQMMCPHGGQVMAISSNTKSKGGGDFLLRQADTFTITGCPLNVAGAPHPCVRVQWVQPVTGSRSGGDFNLAEESVGMCAAADGAIQGTVMVVFTQPQVQGR